MNDSKSIKKYLTLTGTLSMQRNQSVNLPQGMSLWSEWALPGNLWGLGGAGVGVVYYADEACLNYLTDSTFLDKWTGGGSSFVKKELGWLTTDFLRTSVRLFLKVSPVLPKMGVFALLVLGELAPLDMALRNTSF